MARLGTGATSLGTGAANAVAGAIRLTTGVIKLVTCVIKLVTGVIRLVTCVIKVVERAVSPETGAIKLVTCVIKVVERAVSLETGADKLLAPADKLFAGGDKLFAPAVKGIAGSVSACAASFPSIAWRAGAEPRYPRGVGRAAGSETGEFRGSEKQCATLGCAGRDGRGAARPGRAVAMIRILIVDDLRVIREKLRLELRQVPDFEVVGEASNGRDGIAMALAKRPDLILMDLVMPDMDGFAATRAIMERRPTPIVILSGEDPREVTAQAFESGAVEFVSKNTPIPQLIETIRSMSTVRVVGFHVRARVPLPHRPPDRPARPREAGLSQSPLGIVLVGASTGGPQALQLLFSALTPDLPVAYVVVQHIARGFLGSLLDWLAMTAIPKVRVAEHGELMEQGNIYLAPDDFHLHVVKNGRLSLVNLPLRSGVRPSADELFESAAQHERRPRFGVLLTGMGSDGARGLLALRQAGAMTLTQDKQSSLIYGMPAAGVALGASQLSADPVAAAAHINAWASALALTG